MFIRFQSSFLDPHTGRPLGVFHASRLVTEDPDTPKYLVDLILEQRDWFNANLKHPARFNRSQRPDASHIGLSWFRPSATEHIARARMLAAYISEHTFAIATVTAVNPGYVIYNDPTQVVAIPFRR
jgi:hypothetical protein